MKKRKLLGVALVAAAVVVVALDVPQMWADATALASMHATVADAAWFLTGSAILVLAGGFVLYCTASDNLARLYLVSGVGTAIVCMALLLNAAQSGFFAITYNPLGIILGVVGLLALVLGTIRAVR
jgi:hypothetical protein